MPAFCPLCASDDHTREERSPDGNPVAFCFAPRHGTDGFSWEPTRRAAGSFQRDGLGTELGIWDKLLDCVPADGEVHSYGEVEDRFFALYPEEAALLQRRYGHKWRDGTRSESTYSMSVYLSLRLSELAKQGSLTLSWGPATGAWAYNETISHWHRP